MKHTPGPWLVCKNTADVYAPETDTAITDAGSLCYPDYAEAKANARLIAAAPDLLEACQAILATWDKHNVPIDAYICRDRQKLEQAIAKATGQ